jgi:hypothetical protein
MSAYASDPAGSVADDIYDETLIVQQRHTYVPRSELIAKDVAEMALRYLDFDVEALRAISAKTYGASECNEIE